MLKNTILFITLVVLLAGCSKKQIQKEDLNISEDEKKKLAVEYFIQGTVADQKGDYKEAISNYEKALRYDPAPGVYFAIAKDYFLLNKLSLAKENVDNAIKDDSLNIEYYNLLANIYFTGNKVDSSISVYEKIISIDSSNVDAYYSLGLLLERERPYKAIQVYKKLIDNIGPEWNIMLRLAGIYEKLGMNEETEETIEELLKLDPSNLDIKKLLSDLYIKSKNYDKALEIIEDALALFPEDLNLLEMKAQTYLAQNDWNGAAQVYKEIIKNEKLPEDVKVQIAAMFLANAVQDSAVVDAANDLIEEMDSDTTVWQIKLMLGEAKMLKGDDSVAVNYFKKALQMNSENPEPYVRLAGIYFDRKMYDDSEILLDSAVEKFPDNFGVNLILGLTAVQLNKFPKAEKYLKQTLEINSKDITALSAYGYTLNQLEKPKEAIKYLKEALNLEPENVELLTTLGLIYNAQKMFKESDNAYQKALELDSSNALTLNNYAYSLSERGIKLNEALEMSKKAVESDTANSSYLDTMGWIYYQLKDYDKALDYIERANKIDEKNSTILEHLGDVNFRIGNKDKAVELWKKALEFDSKNSGLKNKIEKGGL